MSRSCVEYMGARGQNASSSETNPDQLRSQCGNKLQLTTLNGVLTHCLAPAMYNIKRKDVFSGTRAVNQEFTS